MGYCIFDNQKNPFLLMNKTLWWLCDNHLKLLTSSYQNEVCRSIDLKACVSFPEYRKECKKDEINIKGTVLQPQRWTGLMAFATTLFPSPFICCVTYAVLKWGS